METSLVLTIIGSELILVGVILNVIPKVVNQKTMGELAEEGVNPEAAFRISAPLQNVRRSFGLLMFSGMASCFVSLFVWGSSLKCVPHNSS